MDPEPRERSGRWSIGACLILLALLLVPPVAGASLAGFEIAGRPGSVPWQIADVKPGFHGTGTVTITNTRSDDCSVAIWVGNITGDYALGQYMLYRVSGPRLVTSMTFPARIYDFPQGPDEPRFLRVSPVAAGETITLDWTWEFEETGRPQNEAQGKQLGFVVYYTMLCPPDEMSGWYNVTPEVFRQVAIAGDPCYRMNQIFQEFRVYTCTPEGCTYVVTDHRWFDLGPVLIDEDGDGVCDREGTPTPTVTGTAPATTTPPITPPPATTSPVTTAPGTTVPVTTAPTSPSPTRQPTPVPTIDQALCPPPAVPSGPVTTLTGPSVITAAGYYVLGAGATNTTAPVFLDVRASSVVIDGMGHTIDGVDRGGSYGIRVRGDGPLEGIVIQNVTVNDFAYGIGLFDVGRSRINRVGSTSNTYDGVMVLGGSDNEIACSLIDRDDDGINLTATSRMLVSGNTVTANVRGSGVHAGPGCSGITLTGNLVGGNDEGIELEKARGVTIRSNLIYDSTYRGLNLSGAEETTVVDNYLCNRENVLRRAGVFSGVWSREPGPGPNVMGNPSIGGNYWGTPDGTGFSDVTPDRNGDGFADGTYVLPGGLGTDFYPLGPLLPASRAAATVVAPSTADSTGAGSDVEGSGTGTGGDPAIAAGAEPATSGDAVASGTQPGAAPPTPTDAAHAPEAATGPQVPVTGPVVAAGLACLLLLLALAARGRRRRD